MKADQVSVIMVEKLEDSKATMHYLVNPSDIERRVISKFTLITSTGKGEVVDKLTEKRETLRADGIQYPWKLSMDSMFCYRFGNNEEVIADFPTMYAAARKACGTDEVRIYGHSPVVKQVPGSVSNEKVIAPHPSPKVDLVLQICVAKPATWGATTLGDFFAPAQVENDGSRSVLLPVFRITLLKNTIYPQYESRPLEFVTSRDIVLEPRQCIAMTVKGPM